MAGLGGPPLREVPRGLDFFINTELAYQRLNEYAGRFAGERSLRSLRETLLRDVDFVHDLPLQTLNDHLKLYPFVDPAPLDMQLAEIFDAVSNWLSWVTKSDWLPEVAHRIGALGPQGRERLAARASAAESHARSRAAELHIKPQQMDAGSTSADLDLEQMGRFVYPVPLKLRDLQAMVRPFMEVHSAHHIRGLDAIVGELVRSLLRLFQTVRAWDDILVDTIGKIAEADASNNGDARIEALLELCALCDWDVFEAAHRLHRIDRNVFGIPHIEIENICQKLPLFLDRRMLHGSATAAMDHGLCGTSASSTTEGSDRLAHSLVSHSVVRSLDVGDLAGTHSLVEVRSEALIWWREQSFGHAAPTGIFTNTLLTYLVDRNLHPDPYVSEMLPRVLTALFGVQITCRSFMNRLLPIVGGYSDSSGQEVPKGEGLPLRSQPARCAESLLVFLRQWSDLAMTAEEEEAIARSRRDAQRRRTTRAQQQLRRDSFMGAVMGTGHSYEDVVDLLEGARPLPKHVLEGAPNDGRRYRVDETMLRTWEILTAKYQDDFDFLEAGSRDLGPYLHVRPDEPQEMIREIGPIPENAWAIVNPEVAKAAASRRFDSYDEEEECPESLARPIEASDSLALRLVDWPEELASSSFVSFFAEEGRRVSRLFMQNLPQLPWCFGSDTRNTIVTDIEHRHGVAPFHCLFARARAQPERAVVMTLGDPMSDTYIICPKYQPLQVRHGDRLICHQWTFQIRLEPNETHRDSLSILTDEGEVFDVPFEGCHVGAGSRSRKTEYQPYFPSTKFVLTHRLKNIAAVHLVFQYQGGMNRWTVIDHSPDALGSLLALRPGLGYPLSEGLRLKIGPLTMEVAQEPIGG